MIEFLHWVLLFSLIFSKFSLYVLTHSLICSRKRAKVKSVPIKRNPSFIILKLSKFIY